MISIKPVRELKDFHDGFNIQEYMEQNINMAFGKPVLTTFIAEAKAIPTLFDTFGKNVALEEKEDGTYACTVRVPAYDMEHFAMANWDMITVTSPDFMVKRLRRYAEKIAKKYAGV